MDNDREPMISKHLQDLVLELEQKLANPKNNWKRREDLQAQIADAQKRLTVVERSNQRYGSSYSRYTRQLHEGDQTRSQQRPIKASIR